MSTKFAGADWLRQSFRIEKMSRLGALAADILGQVWNGIYHLDSGSTLKKPDWTSERFIEVNVEGELATYDFNNLTALVIAAHDAPVRLCIRSGGPRRLKLLFTPRTRGATDISERHPTIEEAVREWREGRSLLSPIEEATKEGTTP